MAKRPEDRFQSARELRQALERAALARDGRAGVSGIEATMLASSPSVRRAAPRWNGFAIIVVAVAIMIGNHLGPRVSGNARRGENASSSPRPPHGDGARRSRGCCCGRRRSRCQRTSAPDRLRPSPNDHSPNDRRRPSGPSSPNDRGRPSGPSSPSTTSRRFGRRRGSKRAPNRKRRALRNREG